MALPQTEINETSEREHPPPLIVHVVRQFLPDTGDLEDAVANLCRQLLARGYRVRVVTCNSPFSDPDLELAANEVIDGIEVVRIPWSGSSRYPLAPGVFGHIADADLVHVHAVDFFFDALAAGCPWHGHPMIATTHGGFFHTSRYAALKKIWFNMATRLSALAYRKVVCCSLSDVRLFSGIAGSRTCLVENGADVAKFANCAALDARRRIVAIGRFSVNKRLQRLLAAMQVLAPRHPDWHLDIIGTVSDLSQATIEREIKARGLARHVSLHISPDNGTIRNLIARASLFASASDCEGFGLVAIEAMSAGLLPVLNANGTYRDLAERHKSIRLADFSSAEDAAGALAAAYETLVADDGDLRSRLVKDAAQYAWSAVAERYIRLYEEAMAMQPRGWRQLLRHGGQAT
jgi:alpha-1,3-mannosyltransferase